MNGGVAAQLHGKKPTLIRKQGQNLSMKGKPDLLSSSLCPSAPGEQGSENNSLKMQPQST
jgi:hypothetical protein